MNHRIYFLPVKKITRYRVHFASWEKGCCRVEQEYGVNLKNQHKRLGWRSLKKFINFRKVPDGCLFLIFSWFGPFFLWDLPCSGASTPVTSLLLILCSAHVLKKSLGRQSPWCFLYIRWLVVRMPIHNGLYSFGWIKQLEIKIFLIS